MPKEIPYYYVLEEKNNIFDSKKIFEIPLYQREFAWGYKQITELIDDIYDFLLVESILKGKEIW